jgi:hypothetical protein
MIWEKVWNKIPLWAKKWLPARYTIFRAICSGKPFKIESKVL